LVTTTITTKPATGLGHITICCEGQCAGLWTKLRIIVWLQIYVTVVTELWGWNSATGK
jgi:hypothetical protein